MELKTFTVHANGIDFYCEMMGQGKSSSNLGEQCPLSTSDHAQRNGRYCSSESEAAFKIVAPDQISEQRAYKSRPYHMMGVGWGVGAMGAGPICGTDVVGGQWDWGFHHVGRVSDRDCA